MTLIRAFVRNVRTWPAMPREKAQAPKREAESTDAPERGGLLRSSDEAGVMPVESPTLGRVNRQREEPDMQRKAAAFTRWHEPDDARVSSPDL